nr:MAG TPA: Integrin beta chain VWA domain [Caudoviricetes sp.]
MGGGTWTKKDFVTYSCSVGKSMKTNGTVSLDGMSVQDMYKSVRLNASLNPYNVMRECRDSEEHPNTIPVILALDVTGSMGSTAMVVASELNTVMTNLFSSVKDVEFLVMGIGDLAYDTSPIQASQFESDIRIAEQLDKIYFEGGGGGNNFESYTAAWYFAARHTDLDCWKRGKKGILITMGDEFLNPYLPAKPLAEVTGDGVQEDISTASLYVEARKKYDIYHIHVDHRPWGGEELKKSFTSILEDQHFISVGVDKVADTIVDIVTKSSAGTTEPTQTGGISW